MRRLTLAPAVNRIDETKRSIIHWLAKGVEQKAKTDGSHRLGHVPDTGCVPFLKTGEIS